MILWIPFRCFRNSCNISFPCSYTTKVSSIFLYQWVSLFIAVLMSLFEVFHVEVCKHLSITDFFGEGGREGKDLQAYVNVCVYLVIGLIVNFMIYMLLLFFMFVTYFVALPQPSFSSIYPLLSCSHL